MSWVDNMAGKSSFIISCGKTGGHVFPAIAIAQELNKRFKDKVSILFLISGETMEKSILEKYGYETYNVPGKPFKRRFSLSLFSFAFSHIIGILKVLFLFLTRRPEGVLITGGYTTFPVGVGAVLLWIPLFIQEQNIFPGIVNRILAPFAKTFFVPFKGAKQHIKSKNVILTGNPLREEIEDYMIRIEKKINKKKKAKKFAVFFTGGSQGANSISGAAIEFLKILKEKKLQDDFEVYLHTGQRDFDDVKRKVENLELSCKIEIKSFFYNIYDIYLATDLIVCRAGAMTISELTVFGIPSILVPYPYSTGDHQEKNAQLVVDNKAGFMFKDSEIKGSEIFQIAMKMYFNRELQSELRRNSRKLGIITGRKLIADKITKKVKKDSSLSCF